MMVAAVTASVTRINKCLIRVPFPRLIRMPANGSTLPDSRSRWLRPVVNGIQPNLSPEEFATIAAVLRDRKAKPGETHLLAAAR
jgi:hypothetical protein